MRTFSISLFAIFISGGVASPQDLSPEQWLWVIKSETSSLLQELPNYTCLETLSVHENSDSHRQGDVEDFARVEVAFSGQEELYALAGDHRFSNAALSTLLRQALATTGIYASLARGLMGASPMGESFVDQVELDGERVVHFSFDVPEDRKLWKITFNGKTAAAGEKGSFWASADRHLLRRVSVEATNISPNIGLKQLHIDVDYKTKAISDKRALLPTFARVSAVENDGRKYLSDIVFSHCRAFQSESAVSFGDPKASSPQKKFGGKIPAGLTLCVALRNKVELLTVAKDENIIATVTRPVLWRGKELIRAGDSLEGAIQRSRWLPEYGLFQVTIEFDRLRTENGSLDFYGRVISSSHSPGVQSEISEINKIRDDTEHAARREYAGSPVLTAPDVSGLVTFYFIGKSSALPMGTEMIWKTE